VRRARSAIADPHRDREHLGASSRAAPDEHPGSGAGSSPSESTPRAALRGSWRRLRFRSAPGTVFGTSPHPARSPPGKIGHPGPTLTERRDAASRLAVEAADISGSRRNPRRRHVTARGAGNPASARVRFRSLATAAARAGNTPSAAARHAPLAGSGGPSRSGVAMRPARDRLGAERGPRGSTGPERRAPPVPEPPRGAEAGPTRAVPLRPGQRDGARRRCDRAVKPAGRSAVGASSPSSARRRPRSRYRPAPRSGSSRSRCVARRTLG